MEVYITTRKELYHLVWTEAMTSLAKKLGLPYSNLLKACKDSNIPTPPVGYWQKLKYNKKVKRIELSATQVNPEIKISKRLKKSRKEVINDRIINVPLKLVDPHPLIQQAKIELNEARPYRDGVVSTNSNSVNITVSKASIPRALRIMDTLFKHLIKDGHEITVSYSTTYVIICDEKIEISLREKQKRISNRDTTYLNMYELIPTGKLVFKYGEHSWCSKEVADGKFTLEEQVDNIIGKLIAESQLIKKKNEEIEERKREYELQIVEQQKQRQIKQQNLDAIEKLISDSNKFNKVMILRQYISAVKEKLGLKDSESWLVWANSIVYSMDPINNLKLEIPNFNSISELS